MDEAGLVRIFYERAWNAWDDTVVDDILSPGFTFRGSLGDEVHGPDGWRAYRDKIRQAVPDFHNEVVDLVTSPGRAAARLRYTGHHRGVLLGRPGQGQRIEYAGSAFFTCDDGRLASVWVLGDLDTLRRQLPPAGDPAALVDAWFAMCRDGDADFMDDLTTDDYVCHGPGGTGTREDFLAWLHWYPAAFADQQFDLEDTMADRDRIVARYTVRSTYRGGFLDLPTHDQPVHETGIIIFRLVDGKVAETWYEGNDLQIAQQLGGTLT